MRSSFYDKEGHVRFEATYLTEAYGLNAIGTLIPNSAYLILCLSFYSLIATRT